MKLHRNDAPDHYRFTGYGAGYVTVNHVRYERSVLVSPQAVSDWPVTAFQALAAGDFGFIGELQAEVVLVGTGSVQRFPPPALARSLAATGIGVEVMDTRAACRTYNILAAEGRRVVAAILLD